MKLDSNKIYDKYFQQFDPKEIKTEKKREKQASKRSAKKQIAQDYNVFKAIFNTLDTDSEILVPTNKIIKQLDNII